MLQLGLDLGVLHDVKNYVKLCNAIWPEVLDDIITASSALCTYCKIYTMQEMIWC